MGKTFTLFYLYDNLNKDNVTTENFITLDLQEYLDVFKILNRDIIKAPDKLVNRIIALSQNNDF
ncbi:MAG: hypothetical protein PWP52_2176 [Bacteroidales bacterium]|nr:hypothetical protein [Bacteroidales bacterium]